jgi:hypothetical protein
VNFLAKHFEGDQNSMPSHSKQISGTVWEDIDPSLITEAGSRGLDGLFRSTLTGLLREKVSETRASRMAIATLWTIVLLIAGTCKSPAQSVPTLRKDPQAIALAQAVLSAGGGPLSESTGVELSGTIQIGVDQSQYPIRVYALGSDRIRTEIDRSGGTSLRIVNGGNGAVRLASGTAFRLNGLNTIAQRLLLLPGQSLLAEFMSDNTQLEYLGTGVTAGHSVSEIAISWRDPDDLSAQSDLLSRTRTIYMIDSSTFEVTAIGYSSCAEEDSSSMTNYQVVFSNYKNLSGRQVPTTITTYANGIMTSIVSVENYTEGLQLSANSFDVNGVKK